MKTNKIKNIIFKICQIIIFFYCTAFDRSSINFIQIGDSRDKYSSGNQSLESSTGSSMCVLADR